MTREEDANRSPRGMVGKFLSWPIRLHLLLLILLFAFSVAGIILLSGLKQRRDGLTEATESLRRVVYSVAIENQNLAAGAQQLLATLSAVPEIRSRDVAAANSLLRSVLRNNRQYANIAVADRTGAVWASAVPPKGPVSIGDRRMFRNALATGRFASGEFAIGRTTGKPILNFGYPVLDAAGRVSGVIALGLDLDATRDHLDQASLLGHAGYLLFDHQGMVVRKGMNAKFIGSRDKNDLFVRMAAGPDAGVFRGVGTDGRDRLFAYRKIRIAGEELPFLYARSSVTVADAQARADAALIENLAALAPFPLLAFLITWFVGKRAIVDRIGSLQAAARRLAAGDFHARVDDPAAGGELEDLRRTFNDMADSLHDRERALRKNRNQLRAILDTSQSGIFMTDPLDEYIVFANNRMAEMFGCTMMELIGSSLHDLIDSGESDLFGEEPQEWPPAGDGLTHAEHRFLRRDGSRFWGYVSANPCDDEDGSHQGTVFTVTDVTERKLAEEALKKSEMRLRYLSTHDSLTGLFNRAYFDEVFDRAAKGNRYPVSIIIADVDDLKRLNDSMGHSEGDRLLAAAAEVLQEVVLPGETAARIGGDEFAVLLPMVGEAEMRARIEAVRMAQDRHNAGGGITVRLSLGGATADSPETVRAVFHQADAGMYREKATRKREETERSYVQP